jgi:CRP-like cAMP-binding protein
MKRSEGVQTIMIPSKLFGGYKMRWSAYLVYGYYAAQGGSVEITQQEVADFFGMSRETVQAINAELVLHKLIKVSKGSGKGRGKGLKPSLIEILKR